MNILGLTITRTKALPSLAPLSTRGAWWPTVTESYTGAWQQGVTLSVETVLTFSAVYACMSLIASDIAKMRLRLVSQDADGIWSEAESSSFSPVLRRPNRYQNRIKFIEWWVMSKLANGNTYVLKQRDQRRVVTALYILDPSRVTPLVTPDGDVYYQLSRDDLSGLRGDLVTVPASEIIHDRMCPVYHPLIGVSPIYACGLAAQQGLKIQNNSYRLFANGSNPSGVLTAPGTISKDTAARVKAKWETEFSGDNVGKVAVLGDGLKYEPMTMSAVDAQLIDQLRWTAETVCSCFHVPPYMIGVGPPPNYNNIEALNQQYYAQALQNPIESIELCLDEGLELPRPYGTEFDLDDLLRMDTATMIASEKEAVGAGIKAPNESRKRLGLKPVKGGETPYLQVQNYSLAALDRRDTQGPPPPTPGVTPPGNSTGRDGEDAPVPDEDAPKAWGDSFEKWLEREQAAA